METTKESFFMGLENAIPGNRIGDIGYAVQSFVESRVICSKSSCRSRYRKKFA